MVLRLVHFFALKKIQEPEGWEQLHLGGIGGISSQHLPVDDAFAAETLGVLRKETYDALCEHEH